MSSEWRLTALRELVGIKHGFAFKGEYFVNGKTPLQLTTPGNFSVGGGFQRGKGKYYAGPVPSEYILGVGDVIVSMTDLSKAADTLGYAAVVPKTEGVTWLHNQRVGLVRPNEGVEVCMDYIHYLMRSPSYRHWVVSTATGSTVKHTSPDRILAYEFLLPTLVEQKQIGSILSLLDERVALLHDTISTLDKIARVLFRSWFVDFDPVSAKAEGRKPEGMDTSTAALFPSTFENSKSGMVPSGWQYFRVEELAEKVGMGPFGSNIKVDTFVSEGVPVISGQHLREILVEDSVFNFVTNSHAEKLSNSCVRAGDVIFTHAGSIGQVALLHRDSSFDRYVLSQRQFFLRCNRLRMQPEWMAYYFRSAQGQHQLLANTSQVGVPSIARPVSYLRSIEVLVPSKELIDVFSDVADSLHQSILLKRSQIKNLTRLRDTLLPRLISGQLRLPEATAATEKLLSEAI
ncbi:restriction endonuclease subunit S [Pseudomonas protegens]|uniref:restriction endonuclease subunit S n=1 Tax=Pseudomonas protegens TaxID=380021 RepID=UPI00381FC59E